MVLDRLYIDLHEYWPFKCDLTFWWIGAIWFSAIVWYYYADYLWILFVIIVLCVACWGCREYRLNEYHREIGEHTGWLTLHQGDMKWSQGYLTGVGDMDGIPVKLKGQCPQPPHTQKVKLYASFSCDVIEPNRNRFNFNPQAYWRTKGVILACTLQEVRYWENDDQARWYDWIKTLHYHWLNWFEKLPGGLRDYGETLLLGYTRSDFYADNAGIQKLGLVHLFSISGFQVTLCYRVWFALARILRLYREDIQILWFGWLAFIWFFAGGVQSLIRAILSSGLMNYCELRNVTMTPIDVWGMTVLGSLLWEPAVLHQLGGQLSFLLSFGLLWLQEASFWKTNLTLNMLIAPCLITQTYSWQPVGILANLIVIPVFTWLVVPIVVIGICAALLQITPIVQLCNTLVSYVQDIIRLGEDLPGELISGEPNICWSVVVVICTGVMLTMPKWQSWCALVICYVCLLLGYAGSTEPFIAFVDVNQGDATVWRDVHQESYVMDVGGKVDTLPNTQQRTKPNFVGQQLCQVLKGYGIRKVDHLILSHQDIDHIGNFAYLAQHVPIVNMYLPPGMCETKNYQRQIAPYIHKTTVIHEVGAGASIGKSDCRVCHPFKRGLGKNEDSIVVTMTLAGLRYMLMGDLDIAGEQRILSHYQVPSIDVLKCGHHGSRTSTSASFLAVLHPKLAIISAGKNNRFKHPHEEVLARLKAQHVQMLNTAELGMIRSDGMHWQTSLKKMN
ncbi:ComEC/Rec2 family competence protein [Weissella ceti]|uniref:DNA internalization competence protein ComEC/Rec2-like protein n=2 Tax=Weissella TaxID=46255 RepID=A0A088GK84_9LACO|nr:ComEC/Rec2 family competence protein [Weissella ceti]AIM62662.1 DNA internalization competence protein ComEC/Rec2-like protein [Weissella ceti]